MKKNKTAIQKIVEDTHIHTLMAENKNAAIPIGKYIEHTDERCPNCVELLRWEKRITAIGLGTRGRAWFAVCDKCGYQRRRQYKNPFVSKK